MSEIPRVKPGRILLIDFAKEDVAAAERIESGLVVAVRESQNGVISHILPNTDIGGFVSQLVALEVSPQARIYVVGGYRNESEGRIQKLKSEIELAGFNITAADVLANPGVLRDLHMYAAGDVMVTHYRIVPKGRENVKVTLLEKYLTRLNTP